MYFEKLQNYLNQLTLQFDDIPQQRKEILNKLSDYISKKIKNEALCKLNYICTHNSRRSHFGQVWAKIAALYYGINNVETFSGGTVATAFNPNAIDALKRVGFDVKTDDPNNNNPKYKLYFNDTNFIECFSKIFDDSNNPQESFAAVMTCSDAETNCPFIPGAEFRISTTYEDPKDFDNTPKQNEMYDERCKQIALESLYVFSQVVN